jgi:hypothetical protein
MLWGQRPQVNNAANTARVAQAETAGTYAAGLMFWFTQKKFVGSYFFLIAAKRE